MLVWLRSEAQERRALSAATGAGSEAGPSQRARGTPFPPGLEHSADILSAQFQAAVYEVQAPAEQLGRLDEKALTSQAATPEALLSALAQTGKARLLYRVEQPVNVFSASIIVGASEPVITGTRKSVTGETLNSISYQTVGVIVRLSAESPAKDEHGTAPMVTTAIKLSVLSPGEKEIAPDERELVARTVSLDRSEALELNQPRVLLTISSNAFSSFRTSGEGGRGGQTPVTPVAYVIRYQFGSPNQGSGVEVVASSAGSSALQTAPAGTATAPSETDRSTNALTAQFQATVCELEAATNRLPTLDAGALARATTPELLLNALSDAGKSRVLYRIDQPVNVFSDEVMIGTNKQVMTSTRMGRDGSPLNSYVGHNMGIRVRLSAQVPPKDAKREGPDVTVSFNVSADAPSNTELGLGQTARSFPMIAFEHNEPLDLGRPRLVLAMGLPTADDRTKPFVYVIQYQFDPAKTR
jgi:uncharacterized membrane protein